MRAVGVRELRNNATKVLEEVTSTRRPIDITRHGRVIARLVPVTEQSDEAAGEEFSSVWSDMHKLAEEIGRYWPEGVSAAQAVAADRR